MAKAVENNPHTNAWTHRQTDKRADARTRSRKQARARSNKQTCYSASTVRLQVKSAHSSSTAQMPAPLLLQEYRRLVLQWIQRPTNLYFHRAPSSLTDSEALPDWCRKFTGLLFTQHFCRKQHNHKVLLVSSHPKRLPLVPAALACLPANQLVQV